eukprot:2398843-Pyramimonas_sp.AAC.1
MKTSRPSLCKPSGLVLVLWHVQLLDIEGWACTEGILTSQASGGGGVEVHCQASKWSAPHHLIERRLGR